VHAARRNRALPSALVVAACFGPGPARAQHVGLAGGHVAYGAGAAAARDGGFRHHVDAGLTLGAASRRESRDGLWASGGGPLASASFLAGLSGRPSYVVGELGYGGDTTLAGACAGAGPAVRLGSRAAGGLGARLAGDLFGLQLALRVVALALSQRELVTTASVGFGRY
jgi:hypothetical protein